MKFDIFAKLQENITDFDEKGYYLAGKPSNQYDRSKGEKGGYYFSQKDTLESIDLAGASKYKKGIRDEEGQRKTYLNVVNFYRDVMKMKIVIRVSNYIFEPTSLDFTWPVWLMDRKFKAFADEESYDDELAEYAHDLSTYGTTVTKRLRDCTERVPLRTLRNTQSAKSLYAAAANGGYVILENDYHYNKMKEYPGWNTEKLAKNKSYLCYETYQLVPKSLVENNAWKTNGGVIDNVSDDEDMVLVQAVLLPEERDNNKVKSGRIVWMEKITEDSFPLEECHAEKVDGRWLGRGEIEKQLENQIARNLTANLRRRGLLWAVKKIYQSQNDNVQKNLVMEVKDGEVLNVGANGEISQVNTSNQHLAEFNADEESWKENSQQISFAFNIATGENMPSGTSFSLGVVLERAVSDHFTMVRNTFSNFLKRAYFDQLIPIFRESYSDEHTQQFPIGAMDIENMKESMMVFHTNLRQFHRLAYRMKKPLDPESIRQELEEEMARNPYLFVQIPENFYPDINYYMRLNITDDIGPDVASLTTLYQAMSAKGDPRADTVLKMIFAKQGKSLDALAGVAPKPIAPITQPGAPMPQPSPAAPVAA